MGMRSIAIAVTPLLFEAGPYRLSVLKQQKHAHASGEGRVFFRFRQRLAVDSPSSYAGGPPQPNLIISRKARRTLPSARILIFPGDPRLPVAVHPAGPVASTAW